VRDYLVTGRASRNDVLHQRMLRMCVQEQLVTRGWLGNLGA
jgi:hypothetical protein